jgi:hypothetical protein
MSSLGAILQQTPVAVRRIALGEYRTPQFSVTFVLQHSFEEGRGVASVIAVHRDAEGFWREEAPAVTALNAGTEAELVEALRSVRLESGLLVTLTTWTDLIRVAPDLLNT